MTQSHLHTAKSQDSLNHYYPSCPNKGGMSGNLEEYTMSIITIEGRRLSAEEIAYHKIIAGQCEAIIQRLTGNNNSP
ncbi:hypothetical protein K7432_001790 [Basidiobolus ranarum]|uniref:Uncharacterized protein n=1 Tax=Basidiobolus ranarum TaxID=34480 RepID=A0ABR2W8X1_9FUNG